MNIISQVLIQKQRHIFWVLLKISAKKEFKEIFDYLYFNSTIRLERKYNKWIEIKSAFIAGAVKQMR